MTQPYTPTLHRLQDDTSGRFVILREFLLRFHGLDTGTVGRTVERVDRAEALVREPLPLAVREWVVLLDDLARIGGWSKVLRDSWGLKKVPGCPAFSLLSAGEGDGHWGPLLRDLAVEDPPTSEFVLDHEAGKFKRRRQVAARVSTWAIEFIVSYLRLGHSVQVERLVSRATLDRLRDRCPDGVVTSQIGDTELIEFTGGIVHADPDGPNAYQLRCYAPFTADSTDGYHAAQSGFKARIDAMLGVTFL